jgi:hypothetical protein
MVVGDFDVARIAVVPFETEAVLIVDANAVLARAITLQGFEAVAGRDSQFIECGGGGEEVEFVGGSVFDFHGKLVTLSVPKLFGFLVSKALDHGGTIPRF